MDAARKFLAGHPIEVPANPHAAPLARLTATWFATWHAEHEARQPPENPAILAELNARLEKLHQADLAEAARESRRAARPEQPPPPPPIAAPPWRKPEPTPKPPRLAPEGSSLADEWQVHVEEGRFGPKVRRMEG